MSAAERGTRRIGSAGRQDDRAGQAGRSALVLGLIAGLGFSTLPVMAQTPSQAPNRGPALRLAPAGQPATTSPGTPFPARIQAPRPGVPQFQPTVPIQVTPLPAQLRSPRQLDSGVRSVLPGPSRPGQNGLRLPPEPPRPPQSPEPPRPPWIGWPPNIGVPGWHPRPPLIVVPYFPHHGNWHGTQQLIVGSGTRFVETSPLAPAAVNIEPAPEPMSARDIGDGFLYWNQPDQAIAAYQAHLSENAEDLAALRMLGLALIDAGRLDEGIAATRLAFERDPQVANLPIPMDLYGSSDNLRRNLNRVSMHANRVNTAAAWLTLATMMQIEGRQAHALRMLDRAVQGGLAPEVAEPMAAALGRR